MPWSLAYRPISKRSSGQYLLYGACFFSTSLVDSSTSRFTEAIPCEGTESDRDLLGSGSPSMDLKNHTRDVVLTNSV